MENMTILTFRRSGAATLLCAAVLFAGCEPQDDPMPADDGVVHIEWRTEAAEPLGDEPQVQVILMLSGATSSEMHLGTFTGTVMEQPLVREWWAGTEEALYLERIDATKLVVRSASLTGERPDNIIITIGTSTDKTFECVDDGGCA